ncbi:MAG: hypothetical protein Q8P68_05775 [Candidatus Peregrinibacteria bacterium]|nr:hypothetical protein [Candidatus Peregrinibacteria bacterium]MDZ4244983.1 hypothetical protein [Candidatus Gracilibacteria bacterium]
MNTETQKHDIPFNQLLTEIHRILPETGEYLELLFITLKDFEGVDLYTNNPNAISNCVEDIDEVAEEVTESLKTELSEATKTDPNVIETIRDLFSNLRTSLSMEPNVYKYFLSEIFKYLNLNTMDFEEQSKSTNIYNKYRVPNIMIDRSKMERFFIAVGLESVPNTGKGSHGKWTDPQAEMKGFALSSVSGKIWIKNEITDLLKKGVSLNRICKACKECNIRFENK